MVTSTNRRGAEVFATDLAAELRDRGHVVATVALAPGLPGEGLDLPVLGPKPLSVAGLVALRRTARDADVVVAHGSTTLPACAVALSRRCPFVYRSVGDPRYWSSSWARRPRTALLLRRASAVVALWDEAARVLRTQLWVPAERVHVIPNGAPPTRFVPADQRAKAGMRRRLGLEPDAPVVAYLGSLAPEKRVDLAIAAVALLPGAHLAVAGQGPERPALERHAQEQAPGRVHFLGPTAEPAALLGAADVVVLPSRTEGLPAVLIEAGLCGVPVVATDVGGVGEIVVHGQTGLLVPFGDASALSGALASALGRHQAMGSAARRHCLQHFAMGSVGDAWGALLSEVGRR